MSRLLLCVVLCLAVSGLMVFQGCRSASDDATSLVGRWKLTEATRAGAPPELYEDPEDPWNLWEFMKDGTVVWGVVSQQYRVLENGQLEIGGGLPGRPLLFDWTVTGDNLTLEVQGDAYHLERLD